MCILHQYSFPINPPLQLDQTQKKPKLKVPHRAHQQHTPPAPPAAPPQEEEYKKKITK